MGARSKARKRALDILFESELQGLTPGATLQERRAAGTPPVADYTVTLVEGVIENADAIDELISSHSDGWALERMPAVDRNILRVAVYELIHEPAVPRPVVLDEAVSLAGDLSTDDSPAFVNGVLAAIAGMPIVAGNAEA
jgi:N utilization substance protein B